MAGTIEMFEGVDKPETAEELPPPHAVIRLREITISNFFIKNIRLCLLLVGATHNCYKNSCKIGHRIVW